MDIPAENIEIVRAEPSDLAAIRSIMLEAAGWLAESGQQMWTPDDFTIEKLRLFAQADELYLARNRDVPIGTVILQWEDKFFWPDFPPGESAFIHKLAVRRSVAGKGVSTTLIEWAKATAAKAGRKYLRLDCDPSRPGLCAFYESAGFNLHSKRQMGRFSVARYEICLDNKCL